MYQDYILPADKNPSYKDTIIEHVFMTDSEYPQCIRTFVEVVYKFTPASHSISESPYGYYDQYEIVNWKVHSTLDEDGNHVYPQDVLTEEELVKYHFNLVDFVEG